MCATRTKIINDIAQIKFPALRISNIVYGRERRGNRVFYLVDPKGHGTQKKVAESVVLSRWRKRQYQDFEFDGCRLGPNFWRELPKLLTDNVTFLQQATTDVIEIIYRINKQDETKFLTKFPKPEALYALIQIAGPDRLKSLIERHNAVERKNDYGTPDLFLYSRHVPTNRYGRSVFVEVKKPDEPLSSDQKNEINFLQSLGFHARVLRLIER